MSPQLLSQLIGLLIIVYLAALLIISGRLKKHHAEVWRSLGSFSLANWSIVSSLRMAHFALFSGRHRDLQDGPLTLGIYATRLVVVMTIALIAYFELEVQRR